MLPGQRLGFLFAILSVLHQSPHLLSWPKCLSAIAPSSSKPALGTGAAATGTHRPVSEFLENGQQT